MIDKLCRDIWRRIVRVVGRLVTRTSHVVAYVVLSPGLVDHFLDSVFPAGFLLVLVEPVFNTFFSWFVVDNAVTVFFCTQGPLLYE